MNEQIRFLIIDGSYWIFYRYYAYMCSKRHAGLEFDYGEFAALFNQATQALQRKHRVEWQSVFLCLDCPRADIWRNAVSSTYKGTRKQHINMPPNFFSSMHQDIIPKLAQEHGLHVLSHPSAEADDVAAITKALLRERHPDAEIIVVTNDSDFIQLSDCKTHIVNAAGLDLCLRIPVEFNGCPNLYKQWKIIQGDQSDNILPICKGIGPKRALKLTMQPDDLAAMLSAKSDAADLYATNCQLIDFLHIPEHISKEVRASVCQVI